MEWHWGRWTNNNSGNYQSWSYINLAIMWRRWLEHFHLIFSLPLGILLVNTSLKYRVSDTLSLPAACGGWGWILAADIALESTYLKSQYMNDQSLNRSDLCFNFNSCQPSDSYQLSESSASGTQTPFSSTALRQEEISTLYFRYISIF